MVKHSWSLTFSAYQAISRQTAIYPDLGKNLTYPALGLCGEAGEVAECIKKVMRDNNGIVTKDASTKLEKELGDVLWYLAALCCELELDLGDIAWSNINKLMDRKKRGKLSGSGDER